MTSLFEQYNEEQIKISIYVANIGLKTTLDDVSDFFGNVGKIMKHVQVL
jgi:glycosylphosphatidylinositol transamidase (GPIT) subunit GPI8